MDTLLHDLKYATRRLLQAPKFSAAVILLLALGTGANIALFALTNSLLLRPRPSVRDTDALVWVRETADNGKQDALSYPDLQRFRDEAAVFDGLAGFHDEHFAVASNGSGAQWLPGQMVTADYFTILRTPMALGRPLLPSDDRADAPIRLVLSYSLWQTHFNSDPTAVGSSVLLSGRPATVVGVAPDGFNGPDVHEQRALWVSATPWMRLADTTGNALRARDPLMHAVGRLRPGTSLRAASVALETILARINAAEGSKEKLRVHVESAANGLPASAWVEVMPALLLAFAVTATVLLIACANVSNLLLARGVARRREIAIRLALGATRARVVQLLFVECSVLAVAGAALGLIVATWSVHIFRASAVLPVTIDYAIDWRVIVAAVAVAFAATILFGIGPAFDATRRAPAAVLKDGAQGVDPRRHRLQNQLVVAQIVLSVVLLVGTVLFVQSFRDRQRFDLGFDESNEILTIGFNLEALPYTNDQRESFLRRLRERVEALPGVQGTAFANDLPLAGTRNWTSVWRKAKPRTGSMPLEMTADANYFSLLGIQLAKGRAFTETDTKSAPQVAIVSPFLATLLWPNENPIGQQITATGSDVPYTVVGVARDVYAMGTAYQPPTTVYFPRAQRSDRPGPYLVVRSRAAAALTPAIREIVQELDRTVPISSIRTMAEYVRDDLWIQRAGSTLMSLFGLLALLLASIGVYAVIAFTVGRRQREIGIRLALGASRQEVVALFVRQGARLVAIGFAIGLVLSMAAVRVLRAVLFGTTSLDFAVASATAAAVLLVALAAAWLPARRAAVLDPAFTLRGE